MGGKTPSFSIHPSEDDPVKKGATTLNYSTFDGATAHAFPLMNPTLQTKDPAAAHIYPPATFQYKGRTYNQVEQLRIFRHGVGIPIAGPDLESNKKRRRCCGIWPWCVEWRWDIHPAAEGLYAKVLREETSTKRQYHICVWVINSSMILQIIIGALLTAFGASSAPSALITTFGAVNTVIAGLLALVKGGGLPTRFLQDLTALRNVRDFIEHRECDFEAYGQGWAGGDAKRAVKKARQMYYAARKTIDDNKNDMYVQGGGHEDDDDDDDPRVKDLQDYSSPVTPHPSKSGPPKSAIAPAKGTEEKETSVSGDS